MDIHYILFYIHHELYHNTFYIIIFILENNFEKHIEISKSWRSMNKRKSVVVPPNPILSLLTI